MKHISQVVLASIIWMLSCSHASSSQGKSEVAEPSDQETFTIPAGQRFIIQLETDLHSRTTRRGDRVDFKTAADIVIDNVPVIASGTRVRGTVVKCERAGRLFGNAEIVLRFDEIRMPDGTVLPLRATITRVGFDPLKPKKEGDSQIEGESGASADAGAIVKAGAQGAIIGVLSAGSKGAMYGSAAAAAIAAAGMILRRGPDIDLPRNTMMEARFDEPLKISSNLAILFVQEPRKAEMAGKEAETTSPGELYPESTSSVDDKSARVSISRHPSPEERNPSETPAHISDISIPKDMPPDVSSASVNFRVKVQMVLVDAVVKNRAGRMMDNLTRNDFRVYEDGALQEIQSFSFDELPLAIAIVVDRSGSVTPYIAELRRIATRVLQQLKPIDQVALFSFASTVDRIENLTTDRRRIAESIARIRGGGGTNINDALFEAALYLGKSAPDCRHAIILISDNQATVASRASEQDVIRKALETNTAIYSIKTQGSTGPLAINLPSLILGEEDVGRIARETGGEVLKASKVSSLDATLASVISRLRMRYSLGYYPPGSSRGGAFHTIEVRLDERYGKPGKDYYVEAKRGYYSTSPRQ